MPTYRSTSSKKKREAFSSNPMSASLWKRQSLELLCKGDTPIFSGSKPPYNKCIPACQFPLSPKKDSSGATMISTFEKEWWSSKCFWTSFFRSQTWRQSQWSKIFSPSKTRLLSKNLSLISKLRANPYPLEQSATSKEVSHRPAIVRF